MRQRAKFALEDIRYIQTEIEKILNRDKQKQPERNEKSSESKHKGENKSVLVSGGRFNYSTTPINSKSKSKEKSLSNGKTKSKGKKKKKKSEDDYQDPFFKYLQMRSIPEQAHSKFPKQEAIKIEIFEEPKKYQRQQPQKKSIMELWKQRQKESSQFQQIKKNSLSPKQNTTKKPQSSLLQRHSKQSSQGQVENTSPRRFFQTESVDESSQVIVLDKSQQIPYHLNPKNQIPLRSDTSFLIKKYHPEGQTSARGKELKERYWKLDQRLEKLQQQVRNRPTLPWKEPNDSQNLRAQKKAKKYALADYYHHSPILKFVRINQKLKGDYQRSLSNQQRRGRQKSQDLRPEWVS